MTENHVPGLACAVIKNNRIYWSKAYGLADVENNIPMSVDGIMNIASISKTITATAVMQLWENGQLSLEEDINIYLPEPIRNPHFPDIPITIQQLLTHTSSINDGSAYGESYSCGDPKISLKDWITNYLWKEGTFYNEMENFLLKEPGEQHQYSNVGYGLLGYIVEEITDKPFNSYCQQHIFKPIGMEKSGWFLHEINAANHILPYFYITDELKEAITNGYIKFFPDEKDITVGKNLATCLYSFPNYPDGLLRTSVVELSYFLVAYMNSGKFKDTEILKQSTINKMLSLQIDGNSSQGLCWHKSDFESLWGHVGGDPGVQTKMFYSPETNIGIIIFQNSSHGDQFEILKELYISATSRI
jgi:CubicO group peptidase (beta-lactamase class C family)